MAGSSRSKRQKNEKPSKSASSKDDDEVEESFIQKLRRNMGINKKLDEMTIGEIFTTHPLIRVGKFVLIPYLLYYGWYYLQLQHPEYISKFTLGLINLRPAVHGTNTTRQVLIVATPGSGTVQMSSELRKQLSLEIGHETTDAAWEFTRDGSISWFHGIRFLSKPKDDKAKIESVAKICNADFETHANMGFHPAMYGPPKNKCSYKSKWDECWKAECFVALLTEWGCGLTNSCEINFEKNIHQGRHPMKTLESLVVKYCIGGVDGVASPTFLTYASALFPSHDFYEDSCIEATATFMAMYLEAMKEARQKGHIDAYYRIEKSSVCDVAQVAGLTSPNTTVYEPNYKRISSLCDKYYKNKSWQQKVEQRLNKVNKGQVRLGWRDLQGGKHGSKVKNGDRHLEVRIKNLFMAFHYDEMTVKKEYPTNDYHTEL